MYTHIYISKKYVNFLNNSNSCIENKNINDSSDNDNDHEWSKKML